MKTYYEILEVDSAATAAEIKRAYRRLALLRHPDAGGTKEQFQELSQAYSVLKDEDERKRYDDMEPDSYQEYHQERSSASQSPKDAFQDAVEKIFGTGTSVDEFATAYPRYFMRRDDDAWNSLYPDSDIPYSADEVKILKLEEASALLQENLKYQSEYYSRSQASEYSETADRENMFRVNDGYEIYDIRLLSVDELFRLALGLKKEGWLYDERYEDTINLIYEIDILRSEYENREQAKEAQEKKLEEHLEKAAVLLKKWLVSVRQRERNEKSDLSYSREDHRRSFKREIKTKDNTDVVRVRAEQQARAEKYGGRVYDKQPWKERDNRKQWRKETGGIKFK